MLNDGKPSALHGVMYMIMWAVGCGGHGEVKALNVPQAATAAAPLPSLMEIQRDVHHLATRVKSMTEQTSSEQWAPEDSGFLARARALL